VSRVRSSDSCAYSKEKVLSSSYLRLTSVILFCLLAIYLRLNHLAGRELWNDENFQYHQTTGPFKSIWKHETYGDMTCFPGDYLITYPFVRAFGMNKWGLMIPHLLMTVLGFYFLYRIGQKYFKTPVGYVVAFSIVCFNQYLIFHSLELRPYGVLSTLALMAFYYVDTLWNERQHLAAMRKLFIGLILTLIVWFHAFGILMVSCAFLFVGLSGGVRRLPQSILKDLRGVLLLFVFISLPVWLWFVTGNPMKLTADTYADMGINTFTYIMNPLDGFWKFFNRTVFYHLIGFKRLYFLLGALVFMIFIPLREKLKKLGFFLTLVLLPIAVILSVDLHNGYWFLIRQYIFVTPLFAFFLGWLWDSSVDFYLDKEHRIWNWNSMLGLGLMVICATAGTIGILTSFR